MSTRAACRVLEAVAELVEDTKDFLADLSPSEAVASSDARSTSEDCLEADAMPASTAQLLAVKPKCAEEGGSPVLQARAWLEVLRSDSTWGPLAGFSEIAEDLELGKGHTALLLPITLSLLSGPSASAVWLCGLSFPTKVVCGSVAVIMAVGARSMWGREPLEADRTMQGRCALALCASSGLHLLMAVAGGVPSPLAAYAFQPEVAAHFVQDLVVGPMLILNLGHLVGVGPRSMMPCVALNVASTCGAIGAAAAHAYLDRMTCGIVSLASMGCTAYLVSKLSAEPTSFSSLNTKRCQVAGDLLMFSWTLSPLVQLLGIHGALGVPQQLHVFAVIDVVTKIGTCHLLLRSPSALRNATEHFQAEPLAPSASTARRTCAQARQELVEPCSEPLPRGEH